MKSVSHLNLIGVLLVGLIASASAQAHEYSGYLATEARLFFHSPALEEQAEHNASLIGNVQYHHDNAEGDQRIAFNPYLRVDSADSERTHFDFREAWWWRNFDEFEVYAGLRTVFWGVAESAHRVDILNQTDALENIDGEDKLGQPMIEVISAREWGTVSAYILPYFREREFPGAESRLRAALPIFDEALYQSKDKQKHIDLALRWSHVIGVWDIGLSHFSGTQRNPVFSVEEGFEEVDGSMALRPYYPLIEQSGLDIQATIEAWLFKFEGISVYEKDYGRNAAAVGGIEYSFFSVAGSNADLGLVVEYQFDDRQGARASLGQHDVVVGARWAFNDVDASEILVLASQDLDHHNYFLSLEVSRRLTDTWKVEAQARGFSSVRDGRPEYDLQRDDYLQLELQYYF